MTVTTNDAATMKVASQPALGLPILRPTSTKVAKPARGNIGMRKTTRSTVQPFSRWMSSAVAPGRRR